MDEPEWVAEIPDEADREAVRAVLRRKQWRDKMERPTLTVYACRCGRILCLNPGEYQDCCRRYGLTN